MDKLLGPTLTILFFLLVVSGLLVLAHFILHTVWCGPPRPNSYEPFDAPSPISKRIRALATLHDMLSADLEALDDAADAACNITKQIEDSYVSNNSAPTDESEYQMPQDVQAKRQKERGVRAKQRFETEKKRYSVLQNVAPVYECFEDASQDEEDELRTQIADIQRILDTAEAKAAAAKGESLQSLLGFNAVYLKKGASTVTESFVSTVTGDALLAQADALIKQGNAVHTDIVKITAAVKTQQLVAKGIFQKTNDIQKGKISSSDVSSAMSKFAPS